MKGIPDNLVNVICIDAKLRIPKSELLKIPHFKLYLEECDEKTIYVNVFKKAFIIARNLADGGEYQDNNLYENDVRYLMEGDIIQTKNYVYELNDEVMYKIILERITKNYDIIHNFDIMLYGDKSDLRINKETHINIGNHHFDISYRHAILGVVMSYGIKFDMEFLSIARCKHCHKYRLSRDFYTFGCNKNSCMEFMYNESQCVCPGFETDGTIHEWYKIKIRNIIFIE